MIKKIISLLLAVTICFSFTACQEKAEETEEPKQPTKIVLDASNVEKYLSIEVTIGEPKITPITEDGQEKYLISCIGYITVTSKGNYTFENARIYVRTNVNRWTVSYNDRCLTHVPSFVSANRVDLNEQGSGKTTFIVSTKTTNLKSTPAIKESYFPSVSGRVYVP